MPYNSFADFALTRKAAVRDKLESPELAALMVEKFGEGAYAAGDKSAIALADQYCIEIDSNYKANRRLRYEAYAQLDLTQPRK
jgi:hypothetical protein